MFHISTRHLLHNFCGVWWFTLWPHWPSRSWFLIQEVEAKVSLTDHGKKASTIKHGTCLVSIATGGGRYMYLLKYVFIEKNLTLIWLSQELVTSCKSSLLMRASDTLKTNIFLSTIGNVRERGKSSITTILAT